MAELPSTLWPVGYKYDRGAFLKEAQQLALSDGLAGLTYGKLARRLGIPDRVVVYYFPTKTDLILETLGAHGLQLQSVLARAFGGTCRPPDELVADAWQVFRTPEVEPIAAIFLEVVGLAAAGQAPYPTIARDLVNTWVDWLEPLVADREDPHAAALSVVARIDGLLLVRQVLGMEAADAAAHFDG